MNEKITNELTEQGYSIVNDAFSLSEFENFRAIIKKLRLDVLMFIKTLTKV